MKKSFILHIDSLDILLELSTEQKGELLQAMYDFQFGKEVELAGLMKAVFLPFRNQFKRDDEKYESAVIKNRNNGQAGGRPRKQTKPAETENNPVGLNETQHNPKKADSKNKSDNKNDSDSDNESENDVPFFESLPDDNYGLPSEMFQIWCSANPGYLKDKQHDFNSLHSIIQSLREFSEIDEDPFRNKEVGDKIKSSFEFLAKFMVKDKFYRTWSLKTLSSNTQTACLACKKASEPIIEISKVAKAADSLEQTKKMIYGQPD